LCSTHSEAVDLYTNDLPDLILISLSLPTKARSIYPLIRNNLKTKYTPVFALVVKTETIQQQRRRPWASPDHHEAIDMADLETRIGRP